MISLPHTMDNLIAKLAEKAVKCEKCKFAFSVAAFKEHTCYEKKVKKAKEETEHKYYIDGRLVTRKYFQSGNSNSYFKFKCEDCENWFTYESLNLHYCFKDTETLRPNKNGKYPCEICGFEMLRKYVVKHYTSYHHR